MCYHLKLKTIINNIIIIVKQKVSIKYYFHFSDCEGVKIIIFSLSFCVAIFELFQE